MAEKKDPIRSLIDTGRRAGKLTSSEISDAMEENGNVLDVEAMEKLYEELESNGIENVDDTPVDVIPYIFQSAIFENQHVICISMSENVVNITINLNAK